MLYHSEKTNNSDLVSAFKKINDKYHYDGMVFPADYTSIKAFEELNKTCVFIYEIDAEGKLRLSKTGKIKHMMLDLVYMLRIDNAEESHYVYIKNISRLFNLSTHTGDKDKRFWPRCSQKMPVKEDHAHICKRCTFAKASTCIKLPEEVTSMTFESLSNMLEPPYIVYAVTECSLIPTNDANNVAKRLDNSACLFFVCAYDHTKIIMWSHVGEDSVYEMILEQPALADECIENVQNNPEMVMTDEDQANFENATCCRRCQTPFNENSTKVRDHDHRKRCYRGPAHDRCNINYCSNRFLPVVIRHLKGYDSR